MSFRWRTQSADSVLPEMPTAKVSVSESALADIEELRDWLSDNFSPETSDRLVGGVFDRLEELGSFPELARMVPEFGQPWLRELVRPPLRIVYRLDRDRAGVVRVWRSERLMSSPEETEWPRIAPGPNEI